MAADSLVQCSLPLHSRLFIFHLNAPLDSNVPTGAYLVLLCRISGIVLPIPWAPTGLRGAAGGASARRGEVPLVVRICYILYTLVNQRPEGIAVLVSAYIM